MEMQLEQQALKSRFISYKDVSSTHSHRNTLEYLSKESFLSTMSDCQREIFIVHELRSPVF